MPYTNRVLTPEEEELYRRMQRGAGDYQSRRAVANLSPAEPEPQAQPNADPRIASLSPYAYNDSGTRSYGMRADNPNAPIAVDGTNIVQRGGPRGPDTAGAQAFLQRNAAARAERSPVNLDPNVVPYRTVGDQEVADAREERKIGLAKLDPDHVLSPAAEAQAVRVNQSKLQQVQPRIDPRAPLSPEAFQQQKEIREAGRSTPSQVPGRDIPFSKEVADQRKELSARNASPNAKFTQATRLRSDLFREIKTYPELVDQVSRIDVGAKDPTAAGDVAILFNFMKMLDPSSVVRESEYATAAQAGSLMERAQAAYNRAVNGERLSSGMRSDFVNTAHQLHDSVRPRYEGIAKKYKALAERNEIDPQDVLAGVPEAIYNTGAQPEAGGTGGWVQMAKPDGSKVEVHPEDVESAKATKGYR